MYNGESILEKEFSKLTCSENSVRDNIPSSNPESGDFPRSNFYKPSTRTCLNGFDKEKSSSFSANNSSNGFQRDGRRSPSSHETQVVRPPVYVPPPPPDDEESIFTNLKHGINFDKYDQIPVEVSGVNPPKALNSFEEANLPEKVASNIKRSGYKKPTPVQKHGISIINEGRDIMACAQTGSGKTAAYLLPIISKLIRCENGVDSDFSLIKPKALIIGPTRELVNQIYLEARKYSFGTSVRSVVLYGGASSMHQRKELRMGCNILVATPGRLEDFINRGYLSLNEVKFFVLDEADRMLDMGFESKIKCFVQTMTDKKSRNTLMFSATFPPAIQKLAYDFLCSDFIFLSIGVVGGACSDIHQNLLQVNAMEKRETLIKMLSDIQTTRARTLIFVETKRNADFLACFLSQSEIPTTSIHGDRFQQQRETALRDFKSGQSLVLVATSVASRGLDISQVEHVINYDLPSCIDDYVHRIGRTGRCGNQGKATSFFDPNRDTALSLDLIKILQDAQQNVPDWLIESSVEFKKSGFGNQVNTGSFANTDARRMFKGFNNSSKSNGAASKRADPVFNGADAVFKGADPVFNGADAVFKGADPTMAIKEEINPHKFSYNNDDIDDSSWN